MACIRYCHHDDGKGKWQSHEFYLRNPLRAAFPEEGVYSYDLTNITGYGETKEEALEEFLRKFDILLNQYEAIYKTIQDPDLLKQVLEEVDCFGDKIE